MTKRKLFMLVWDIDVDKGGINRVMMNRSKLLSSSFDVSLLTLDYKKNYPEIEKTLRNKSRLSPEVNIINVHDYYRRRFTRGSIPLRQLRRFKKEEKLIEKGYSIQLDEYETKKYARYFQNGVYSKYKKWSKKGKLSHIDYFNENRYRVQRDEFHKEGYLYRRVFFDFVHNKPVQELLYTPDGFCFLNKWFNSEDNSVKEIFLFERDKNNVSRFPNNREFHKYWLSELCSNEPLKPIIICDGPGSAIKVLELNSSYVHKIFAIHSNHFKAPHKYGAPIKENHISILENLRQEEALVVLTESQKQDIIKQFGDYGNVYVIPHSITPMQEVNVTKDLKLVSMVARLHAEKGIDEAIHAFRLVVKEVPDAILTIYGEGPDKKRLSQLIKELDLSRNIKLMGYSNYVEEVFSKSLISLVTSKFEGFGLVILESMYNKAPVISYDVAYGPSEIIVDGKNGYLVPDKDKEALANQIIYLLKNTDKAISMGEQSRSYVIENYSEEINKNKWLDLISNLL